MEISIGAVFSHFSIFTNSEEAETFEHNIDLLIIANNGWNVELHRNRSQIPAYCTIRLPPLKIVYANYKETKYSEALTSSTSPDVLNCIKEHQNFNRENEQNQKNKEDDGNGNTENKFAFDVITGVVFTINKTGLVEMITSRNVQATEVIALHVKQMLRRWAHITQNSHLWREKTQQFCAESQEQKCKKEEEEDEEWRLKEYLMSEKFCSTLQLESGVVASNNAEMTDTSFRIIFFNCILKPSVCELQRLKLKLEKRHHNINNKIINANKLYEQEWVEEEQERNYSITPRLELKEWFPEAMTNTHPAHTSMQERDSHSEYLQNSFNNNDLRNSSLKHSFKLQKSFYPHRRKRVRNKNLYSSYINADTKLHITSETTIRWLECYLQNASSPLCSTAAQNLSCKVLSNELSRANHLAMESKSSVDCVYTISSNDSPQSTTTTTAAAIRVEHTNHAVDLHQGIVHNAVKVVGQNEQSETVIAEAQKEQQQQHHQASNTASHVGHTTVDNTNKSINNNNTDNVYECDEYLTSKSHQLSYYLKSYEITRMHKRSGIQLNLEWDATGKLERLINKSDNSNNCNNISKSKQIAHTHHHGQNNKIKEPETVACMSMPSALPQEMSFSTLPFMSTEYFVDSVSEHTSHLPHAMVINNDDVSKETENIFRKKSTDNYQDNINITNDNNINEKRTSIDDAYKHISHEQSVEVNKLNQVPETQAVSCLIFTSGIVQITAVSLTAVENVTKLILLPLLLYHSDMEKQSRNKT